LLPKDQDDLVEILLKNFASVNDLLECPIQKFLRIPNCGRKKLNAVIESFKFWQRSHR